MWASLVVIKCPSGIPVYQLRCCWAQEIKANFEVVRRGIEIKANFEVVRRGESGIESYLESSLAIDSKTSSSHAFCF